MCAPAFKAYFTSFDDIWEPSEKDNPEVTFEGEKDPVKIDITKEEVPPALLMKMSHGESEISRDEEATVMIQLDILRGIHSDLHHVSEDVSHCIIGIINIIIHL